MRDQAYSKLSEAIKTRLQEIEAGAERDFLAFDRLVNSPSEARAFAQNALATLYRSLIDEPALSGNQLGERWNQIVSNVYVNPPERTTLSGSVAEPEELASGGELPAFIRTALVPTLILKSLIVFFGLNYSMKPGEGYGWGLLLVISISLVSFTRFIWVQSRLPSEGEAND